MITLFVYVDGSDLDEIADLLMRRFTDFVQRWDVATARVVNDRRPPSPGLREGDFPDWDLGLNFTIDRLPRAKIEELVTFLSRLARETNREFIIGGPNGEDWFSVQPEPRENIVELLAEQIG
jgi:hypothetical protein